jgi:hypothetical protein
MNKQHYLVPQQNEGFEKDITHAVTAKTIEDAEDWFVDAKERLLDINNWEKYAPFLSIEFRLSDGQGKGLKRSARRHDHIRIDIPGSVSNTPGGFDWATIEAIEYDDYPDDGMETFALRIRPSEHPEYKIEGLMQQPLNEASSTFVIGRQGKNVFVTYHGRNELVYGMAMAGDHDDAEMNSACWLGLSDTQWENLVKGLLK